MEFELVTWPEVQDLMTYEGFHENACLANDEYFVETYGSSAYFVNKNWLYGEQKSYNYENNN